MPLRAALLLIAVLVAAGCAGPDRAEPAPPAPEPVSTPPPEPLPPAMNGDDVKACAEGSCEIRVAGPVTIPLNPRFGVSSMRVDAIGPDKITFGMTVPPDSPNDHVTYSPNCEVHTTPATASAPATVTGNCLAGGRVTLKTISAGVAVIRPNAAIIRLQPL